MNETRYCWQCGTEFIATRDDHHFCAPKCVAAYYRDHQNPEYIHAEKAHEHVHFCEECGYPFIVNDYAQRGGKREPKYCSTACKQKAYRKRAKSTQQQAGRRYSGNTRQNAENERTEQRRTHSDNAGKNHQGTNFDVKSRSDALRLLGLTEGFSQDALKKRYRQMMRTWHPDVNKSPDALRMSQAINAAYERLSL